jgi:hypothetical protein
MGRLKYKPNISDDVISLIKVLLFQDEALTGQRLKDIVEAKFKNFVYTVRTYQAIKSKLWEEVQTLKVSLSGLDSTWYIGSCAKYNIPTDMIPVLLKEQRLRTETNLGPGDLKVIEAMWLAKLYNHVYPIARRLFPGERPDVWHGMVSVISRQYAYSQFDSELKGEKDCNTYSLDFWYLIKEDSKEWESIKCLADNVEKKRDPRFINRDNEPPRPSGIILYSEQLLPEQSTQELEKLEGEIAEANKIGSERDLLRNQNEPGELKKIREVKVNEGSHSKKIRK